MTICFKHMEYLHFFINSCVPSLFYTVRIVLVMQSDNVFIILKHACEQATFWSQKVEFQNVLMSMLISIPGNFHFVMHRFHMYHQALPTRKGTFAFHALNDLSFT